MYRKILVPWDGSALSETALGTALPIARRHRASVQLVHVHQPPALLGLAPMYDTRLDAEQRDLMMSEQKAMAERVSAESGVKVEAEFLNGEIVQALVAHAERTRPDLIVMTTHGRGGLSRLWLGSITDAMVRRLQIPIVVIRGRTQDGAAHEERSARSDETAHDSAEHSSGAGSANVPVFSRVLVPLDGSGEDESFFPAISALVSSDAATLALLTIVTPQSTEAPPQTGHASAYLENLAKSLSAIGIRATTHVATHESVASAILNFASEGPFATGNSFDLIVLTPHERTPVNRLLLGSVTDKVLRGAEIPVLLLRRAAETAAAAIRENDND